MHNSYVAMYDIERETFLKISVSTLLTIAKTDDKYEEPLEYIEWAIYNYPSIFNYFYRNRILLVPTSHVTTKNGNVLLLFNWNDAFEFNHLDLKDIKEDYK